MSAPSRRDLFKVALPAAAAVGAKALPEVHAQFGGPLKPIAPAKLIVRMHEPRNLEVPVDELLPVSLQFQNDGPPPGIPGSRRPASHFVRSHFAVPKLDAKTWTLKVGGHVETPLQFTLDELKRLPTVEKTVTLECAGNGRVFLVPQVRGLQWGFGGVSQAKWTGVTLASILDKVQPKKGAEHVVLSGADSGNIGGDVPSPGPIHFDRGIPIEKAMKPESLLAWLQDGRDLPPAHGYPLRAVLAGWYGMASVKWLTNITITDKPYDGFWQTIDYSYYKRDNDRPSLTPVTAMLPKAIITSHGEGSYAYIRQIATIEGLAWAGELAPRKVEFSDDGGTTWKDAKLIDKPAPFEWARWSIDWAPKVSGVYKLVARCTDTAGNTQPDKRDPDRRTYMINHLVPIEVTVV